MTDKKSAADLAVAEIRAFVNCSPYGDLGPAIMEHVFGQPTGIGQRAEDFARFAADRLSSKTWAQRYRPLAGLTVEEQER